MKAMFIQTVKGGALALALGFSAVQSQADTLADALVGSYNHSGLLDQNRALLRAADEGVAIAASALLPIIQWSAGAQRDFGRQLGTTSSSTVDVGTSNIALTASLLLYDSGSSAATIESSKETVLATRQTLVAIEQQVLLRAIEAFMGVRQASEFVALRQNNLRLLTQELRAANDRFEVGEVTRTDVALAQARLAQARSGLADAQADLLRARAEYTNVVGHKPGRLSSPPKVPNVETNVASAQAQAVRRHPQMISVQHSVSAAELLILAAEADMKPSITLSGRLRANNSTGASNGVTNGFVAVEVGGPLYAGGSLSAAMRRAMASRDAERGNLHVVRHDTQQNVASAIASLGAARARLQASERQIRAARVAFRGVREEATLGARTTLDVLDAEQELLDAEAARISAEVDEYVAAYTVLSTMGLLTATSLRLNVQQYDPTAYYNLVKDAPAVRSKQGQKLDKVLRALQKD
ncbi:MAG: TolC family outer membrane protein [Ascidiaceihabitans sp.]|nr:TolC family outer membrane protein [Ascidiaceihabitans sp.]